MNSNKRGVWGLGIYRVIYNRHVIKSLRAKIIHFNVQMEENECICFTHDVYATDPSNNVKLNKVYQETITTNIAELLLINA